MPKNHLISLVYDQHIIGKSTTWPKITSKRKNDAKNSKKLQKNCQKFHLKMAKTPQNRLHWEPPFPCYTEAHLENQGAYSLRSLTAPWFSRWASVTF